ncbi:TonB family protein [Hymenobacter volaticus]|uniref:TonB family protein n=1 Tax=Hymenobacter volaticus TaxID=2932254 RepID=A0ABY4G637_9BACT|nr:TonB family protein [Hymenobacter volaticus]UOQ66230.1 TonB family protein [Hymenobacter volaticus]
MRPADHLPALLSPDASGGQHLPMAVLRQYVAGTLSAAEQHRVEAHTLACSRCADVLEGLSQTDLATTDQALSELQIRLRARLAQENPDVAPVVPMWPWRQMVAAIVLLLVSTAIWLGVRRTTEGPAAAPQVAMRQPKRQLEKAEVAKPSLEAAPAAPEAQTETEVAGKAIASAPVLVEKNEAVAFSKQERTNAKPKRQQQQQTSTEIPAVTLADAAVEGTADVARVAEESKAINPVAADTTQLASSKQASANEEQSAAYARMAPAPKAKLAGRSKLASTQAASDSKPMASNSLAGRIESTVVAPAGMRVVRGQVTDRTSGAALPGVTVIAKGTNLGTSTAADGSFSLLVPESVGALTFSYVGFTSSEQRLAPADSMVALALTPDTKSLNETVVVRRERPPAPMSIGALPAGGYKAFQAYLKDELEYPEQALKEGKEGNVKLSFTVAEDGSLQNIKVVRGISEECDAEAIRLLKEGPKWYPAVQKGRRTARTVEVNVPFRPEDHR